MTSDKVTLFEAGLETRILNKVTDSTTTVLMPDKHTEPGTAEPGTVIKLLQPCAQLSYRAQRPKRLQVRNVQLHTIQEFERSKSI